MKNITILLYSLLFTIIINSQEVTTFAGSGIKGNLNGIGTATKLFGPTRICTDATGENLYFVESDCHAIKKIHTATALVSTVAGGTSIISGYNDGIGNQAQFNNPIGICEYNGYLYVADNNNYKIRKIEIGTGTVTTLAGSDFGNENGIGTVAKFKNPNGICQYNNCLYVTDRYNYQIRKIDLSTGLVSTLAGSNLGFSDGNGSEAQFNELDGICSDRMGNLYVADIYNNAIRKIVIATGEVSTVEVPPFLLNGSYQTINSPTDVCIDKRGDLYITTLGYRLVIKLKIDTGESSVFAGSSWGFQDGFGTNAKFVVPYGICSTQTGDFYICDTSNYRIRKITVANVNLNQDNAEKLLFKVYPNPASNWITVETPDFIPETTLTISDLHGRIVYHQILENTITLFSTSSLSNGVYVLSVTRKNEIFSQKIVIK